MPELFPALSVVNLHSGYPASPSVIRDVTFSVERGERIGVLGPNGAGKSTLFKSVVGLMKPRAGQVLVHGQPLGTAGVSVGYVAQSNNIDMRFPATVRDIVMMGRTHQIGWLRRASVADWQLVDQLIERVGMSAYRDRQIGQLSGGQRRRVFIARALAQNTDVLLLDEPFAGVDHQAEKEILQVLDRLKQDGVTVLLATHDMHMATTQFDRLLMINRTVIAYDCADAVFTPPTLSQTFGGQIGIFAYEGNAYMLMQDSHT